MNLPPSAPNRPVARVESSVPGLALALCLLTPLVASPTPVGAHGVTRFDNGRWWRGGELRPGTFYSVDGVLELESQRPPDRVVDLEGAFVLPPLADAHSHSLADPNFESESARFLSRGIFYVQNPNGLASWSAAAREKAAGAETVDVTYAMGGLTSPGGHPTPIYDRFARHSPDFESSEMDGEAFWAIGDLGDLDRVWGSILEASPDFLKIYLEHSEDHERRATDEAFYGKRGLDPELVPVVVERAHADGLRVAAHVASAADFRLAVAAGVDELAHLPLERLEPDDARAAAAAGVVVVTTTLSHRPVDDPATLPAVHAHNLSLLVDAGVEIVLGTDSERGLLAELLEVQRLTGWPATRLVEMATVATPQWIFPDRRIGALEPDHEASFLAYDANPFDDLERLADPTLIVKGGHVLEVESSDERPGVANALAHTLMRDGVEAAIAEYRRLRAEAPDDYDFSEPQLNALGYFALEQSRPEAAVEVFRLNAELFPTSSNVWDSLGDGLVAAEDFAGAIRAYGEALERAPDNEDTRRKLEETEARLSRPN